MTEQPKSGVPRLPRIFDYAVILSSSFDYDVRNTSKISKEAVEKIARETALWVLKEEYYSKEKVEEYAKGLGLDSANVTSAINLTLILAQALYDTQIEEEEIVREMVNGGLSEDVTRSIITGLKEFAQPFSNHYVKRYGYRPLLERIFWRIDMKIADTKRWNKPELRIFMELRMQGSQTEGERSPLFTFEMREDDLFILTSALSDIATEISKIKQNK